MPKRTDIKSILVIGSGPIVIGQACEFDYSGNQALRALRQEGYKTILVNSNPATIMTDEESADAVYIEPLTTDFVRKVIEKEKPDAILPTMGGQTALNIAVDLEAKGILRENNVTLLGAKSEVIRRAENREEFRQCMVDNNIEVAKSHIVRNMDQARAAIKDLPFPVILRPSFTLGGEGGGTANSKPEYLKMLQNALDLSPVNEVLVEESLIGWKEYELEVVRDKKDNVIIVCSIENMDPMGVHTGDSITVAPQQTLTDAEYQKLRDIAIKVIRVIGVETGGSNVQFAVNPKDGRYVVIEINPRVSRSSALASKATGFPIAKVAARLAVGYTLDELKNDVTKTTPASFEPTLDYVVVKIPRFDFEKFQDSSPFLATTMKSVGEVMAIGTTFKEAFQKALASSEKRMTWLGYTKFDNKEFGDSERASILRYLENPHHRRIFYIGSALRHKISTEEIVKVTQVDPWFVHQMAEIISIEKEIESLGKGAKVFDRFRKEPELLARIKAFGFSDHALSILLKAKEEDIRSIRHKLGVRPRYQAVDTCAAEFEAFTPYLYSTYANWQNSNTELELKPIEETQEHTVMILGGGPNRIGQGIEFDYCCVHGAMSLQDSNHRVVMVNCNPETVSTDFDVSDRLYFEPVTTEHVLEISYIEKPRGVIVQFGGQTPLKIAAGLDAAGLKIIGTSVDAIDQAEDRKRCEEVATRYGLKTPENGTARTMDEALGIASKLGLPILVRPSYVLGGRAMRVIYHEKQLRKFVEEALEISDGKPVYLDRFLDEATEIDVDVLSDGQTAIVGGILEHIEKAGVHSGDSSCVIPVYSLSKAILEQIYRAVRELAFTFSVKGLMNVQLAVHNNEIFLIEVNPRASRTVPFVSKAIGTPLAKIATQLMIGKRLKDFDFPPALDEKLNLYHVKGPVFPFNRFDHTDTILGPEMRSTGEVMGRADGFGAAFAKSLIAAGMKLPESGKIFLSIRNEDKSSGLVIARELTKLGFQLAATKGTHALLTTQGVAAEKVKKLKEGENNCVDQIRASNYCFIINTTSDEKAVEDSFWIRRSALETQTPCITTISAGIALVKALEANRESLQVAPLGANQ